MLKREIGRRRRARASASHGDVRDRPARAARRGTPGAGCARPQVRRLRGSVPRLAARPSAQRLAEYLPLFAGASDVLDVGCGRGEFLALLREHGITARGIDMNEAMVRGLPRARACDADEGDALAYLRAQPDGSLGGLFAAQVVEHLEPAYLDAFLDAAFDEAAAGRADRARNDQPGVLVRVLRELHPRHHPRAAAAPGHAEVPARRHRLPAASRSATARRIPSTRSCSRSPRTPPLADAVETLNANVEKINRLLFTCLDYAAIGYRP